MGLYMINKLNNLSLNNNDLELNSINTGESKGEISNALKDVQQNYNKDMVIKIKEMIAKAEMIAIKIVKGESLTPKEKEFINKKYPQLKEFATKSYKEANELKIFIKMSKLGEIQNRDKDINNLLNNEKIKNNNLLKECKITESEWKIKQESIGDIEKYFLQVKKDLSKLENILLKFIKGKNLTSEEKEFIDKKYPESKNVANEIKNKYESLKNIIKECKSREDVDEIISKEINKLKKEEGSKGSLSQLEVKIKLLILEDEDDIYSKIINPELIYTVNPFVYFKTNLMSVSLICLGIASIILVVSLLLR